MTYKALLSDVDGTLMVNQRHGLPTQRVIDAMAKAQKKIHIGIATSRPLFKIHDILKVLPLSGPCIVSGGTQISDATTEQIVWQKSIDHDDFWSVTDIILPHSDRIIINEGDHDASYTPKYKPQAPLGIYLQALTDELAEILIKEISNVEGVSVNKIASHTPGMLDMDVTHALATKHHGVLEVAQLLDIDTKEIIGVGDGYNDFPLLMACGLRVAMGNAVDDLKAIADYIAPTVDDDGLATVIEKFVLHQ